MIGVTQLNGQIFEGIVPKAIRCLQKLTTNIECTSDYTYYQTPNPWLQIRLMKVKINY